MLVEFRVENFRNFKEGLVFKLNQVKKYEFNTEAITNEINRVSLIYGENGSGKSNLGLAIFDISVNLTDKEKNPTYNVRPFINLTSEGNVKFCYKFKFDSSYLVYEYEKDTPQHLVKEEVFIDDKRVIYYNHLEHIGEVNLEGTETLNKDLKGNDISFVKYIRSNAVLANNLNNSIFQRFTEFVDNMAVFSSLTTNSNFDLTANENYVSKKIIQKNSLRDFELFLRKAGLEYKLLEREVDGQKSIYCDFNGNEVNFFNIASKGTRALTLFYFWLLDFKKISLVFIDEFDAFYHNNLARIVVQEVLKSDVAQAIITTHNTSIMDNDFLRPDCYFNLVKGRIESFANLTPKDLRKAHNIEKMYRAGSFDLN